MKTEEILKLDATKEEKLQMIISNTIDVGSSQFGGMISVAKFAELGRDIIKWHESALRLKGEKKHEWFTDCDYYEKGKHCTMNGKSEYGCREEPCIICRPPQKDDKAGGTGKVREGG